MKPVLPIFAALLLGSACALAPVGAFAKDKSDKKEAETIELPEKLSPEEADALLAKLTDAQARQLLARQLHKQAQKQAKSEEEEESLAMMLVRLRSSIESSGEVSERRGEKLVEGWRQLPAALETAAGEFGGGPLGLLRQLAIFAVIGALGMLASRWLERSAVQPHFRQSPPADAGFGTRLGAALWRTPFELVPLAGFAALVLLAAEFAFPAHSASRTVQIAFATGAIVLYAVVLLLRFVLSPDAAGRRLLAISDDTAVFLHRWLARVLAVWIFSLVVLGLLLGTGMPPEVETLVRITGGALVSLMLVAMTLAARRVVAAQIRAGDAAGAGPGWRDTLANTWHWFGVAYVVMVWLLWAAGVVDHGRANVTAALASLGAVLVFPLLDRWIGRGIDDLFSSGTGEAFLQRPEYAVTLHRVMRVLVVVMLFSGVSELWGFNLFGEIGVSMRKAVLSASFDLLAALAIAALGWHFVKIGIDRRLHGQMVDGVLVPAPPRLLTLLPLARKFILVVLTIMTLMLVLSGLGVNIGPLLAGAGVLGLAIGFGAQTLVKDILTGVFFLMDDAFRIGEYIQSGNYKGTVEDFGLRSVKLRHHRGPVFTVPFGELKAIQNMSRDWVIDKFNIGITYDSDIDKAKKLIKQVGKTLAEDAELGPKFIEPLKMQGVEKFGDFAVQIRVKMKTMPNEQFVIRRKAFAMIKKAFDANGVKFAYPTVQVSGGNSDDITAAAARQALQLSKPAVPDA